MAENKREFTLPQLISEAREAEALYGQVEDELRGLVLGLGLYHANSADVVRPVELSPEAQRLWASLATLVALLSKAGCGVLAGALQALDERALVEQAIKQSPFTWEAEHLRHMMELWGCRFALAMHEDGNPVTMLSIKRAEPAEVLTMLAKLNAAMHKTTAEIMVLIADRSGCTVQQARDDFEAQLQHYHKNLKEEVRELDVTPAEDQDHAGDN